MTPVFDSYDVLALKATVYPITDATRNHIAIVARPRGNDWLCDEITAFSREGIEILVSMLTNEEAEELGLNDGSAECAPAGISFVNVAIPDRAVPSDRNASCTALSDWLRGSGETAAIHHVAIHCRASIGRSSGLAECILVRLGWDANTAFDTIESARGFPVPATSKQKQWVISNVPAVPWIVEKS